MGKTDSIRAHDEEAHIYDQQVREYEYFAHDVLFGMCYQYVNPGERLLDLGIGTGLASLPFARAGLEVYGLDGSTEMLRVCESKGFAKELKCFNLLEMPLPYSRGFFSHVISCGVFHFFGDIGPMVKEVSRIMGSDGTFAFTVAVPPGDTAKMENNNVKGFVEMDTPWGVSIFAHSHSYVSTILREHGFETLKRQRVLMRGETEGQDDMAFAVYVTGKGHTLSA
jgi:predicted TPR repeat methyltransferase